jgi:hypothetical protein
MPHVTCCAVLCCASPQGKLEAIPMSEAISVLEQAWAVAYKEVGKEDSMVPTIDMITGGVVGRRRLEDNALSSRALGLWRFVWGHFVAQLVFSSDGRETPRPSQCVGLLLVAKHQNRQ